jgi:osmotically inducible protein OsmC
MAGVTRTAEVDWKGSVARGEGALSVGSGAFEDRGVSYPRRAGDAEGHTTPEELLAAAHAACFAMSVSGALGRAGHEPESLKVGAAVTVEITETGPVITRIDLTARGVVPGADEAQFREAAEIAKKNCPVSRALAGVEEITLDAALGG